MKILLIEDDRDYAETLTDVFSENRDHDFLWVESLEETEGAINNKKWDIILSDVHLDFHPERILELHKKSTLNHETPLIFLTAERETKLAFDLIEEGDFPVVSKFEIDEDILSVVRNYSELYNLIKRQEDEDEQVSFRKFIARYINEKRYENSELSSSLSGWIDQERFIFSKLQTKKNLYAKSIEGTKDFSFRGGYLKIDANDFHIKAFSPGIKQISNKEELLGKSLQSVIKHIVDAEKLYDFLHYLVEKGRNRRTQTTLSGIGSQRNIQYDFFVYPQYKEEGELQDLDIEVIQNRDTNIEKAELFNLKEANKLLTQEVHHRVNNNLNVITSLLNLRMMNADSEKAEVYQAVLEQITPITTVYEQLYSTKKIASVNLKRYLEDLNRKVFSNGYHTATIAKVHVENEKLHLNLNQVISLGLLQNEILQMFKERNLNIELTVSMQYDVINLVFQADNVSTIVDEEDSLSSQQDDFILNALLNKLGALISVSGKDKIVIRFKKDTKRGGGTNLSD